MNNDHILVQVSNCYCGCRRLKMDLRLEKGTIFLWCCSIQSAIF